METLRTSSLLFICTLLTCFVGCGTLGGFDIRTFPTSKQNVVNAIDTIYARFPEYTIPDKWKPHDDWKASGYGFLDERIFYFNSDSSNPEEMYYVTFVKGNLVGKDFASIAIRSVYNSISGWVLEDNTSAAEEKRIQGRFDQEIISKIDQYTGTIAISE